MKKNNNACDKESIDYDLDLNVDYNIDLSIEEELKLIEEDEKLKDIKLRNHVHTKIMKEIDRREAIRNGELLEGENVDETCVEVDSKELKQEERYHTLSQEDKEALELGRLYLANEHRQSKSRKRRRMMAAAAVLVMTFGASSVSMTSRFKELEVADDKFEYESKTTVESELDIILSENTEEQAAYDRVKGIFGVDVCWLLSGVIDLTYDGSMIAEDVSRAEIQYYYGDTFVLLEIVNNYNQLSGTQKADDDIADIDIVYIGDTELKINRGSANVEGLSTYSVVFHKNNIYYYIVTAPIEEEIINKIINNMGL